MNNSPYSKYLESIRTDLQFGQKRNQIRESQYTNLTSNNRIGLVSSNEIKLYDRKKDECLFESLNPLAIMAGKKARYNEKPGSHPDFLHIKTDNTVEHHYITTMFIDIKNSKSLFKKYKPLTVANITMTLQRAAIHTCWYFDGYIQRFNGDGLMVYFGGKNITITESVNNAISAGSFFSYFMRNDLKELFNEQGIENIYTRIGIDTGDDETVLWHLAGMGDCSEITTCSLHTSLACQLQSNASSNGIMVGDNVKINTSCPNDLFSIKWNEKEGKEERYIFQIPEENFNYTQWQFNWERFLSKHLNVKMDNNKKIIVVPEAPAIFYKDKNIDYLKQQVENYRPYMK